MEELESKLYVQNKLLRTIRNLLIVGLSVTLIALLKALASLLLPLVLAILLVLVTLPLVLWLKNKGFPKAVIIPLVALITISIVVVIINILASTFTEVISQQNHLADQFEQKVKTLYQIISSRLNLQLDMDFSPLNYLMEQIDLQLLARDIASSLGSFGSSFFLFTLYYVFLLIGVSDYKIYLAYVAGSNKKILDSFETIQGSIATYITIKSIISLITAMNVFLICTISGVSFAVFWGFLAFFLNFIPNIGSIISTLVVMMMAFIQFDGYSRFLVVSILLTANQMIIGNFIDPLVMGVRLRLNTVTVIFGLVFWGYIWDIPGMLLSVPLMVAIKLVIGESESLGIIARIMGNPERITKKRRILKFKRRRK